MKWVILIAVVTAIIALWVHSIRPRLRKRPEWNGFFESIEPFERWVYLKAETVLWARTKIVVGFLLTALTQLGAIDITYLLPFVPDQYDSWVIIAWNMLPMVISVVGWIDERMRKLDTTKPIELVQVSEETVDRNPEVAEKIAQFEEAKAEAVAAVKATGTV